MESGDIIIPLDGDEESGAAEGDEPPIDQQLNQFREQWAQELKNQNRPTVQLAWAEKQQQQVSQEEKEAEARYLFLQGTNAEQNGQLYDAIKFYRRAVQLVPDIEFRIEEFKQVRRTRMESESSVDSCSAVEEDEDDLDNLIEHFNKLKVSERPICEPEFDHKETHISELPVELLMYVFKWVISTEIDVAALEQLAMVCRGFFMCARDEEIWRLICTKIWGVHCGRPGRYGSYRSMYIERPHLRFNGLYISKASYYRLGQQGMDNFYKPYHVVEYYRYVRFFPDGQVLLLTSPDEPHSVVHKLKHKSCKIQGILVGYYKMAGDQVTAVLKRKKVVDNSSTISYYRYKRQQRQAQQNQNDGEQSFHSEFTLKHSGKKRFVQLHWNHYAVHTHYASTGQETVTDFEVKPETYPPLIFSRVMSYTSVADAPLK